MNPLHYVSLEIAELLIKAGIKFPESEIVWIQKRETVHGEWRHKKLVNRKGYIITWHPTVKFTSAPSLMEIMDRLPNEMEMTKDKYRTGYHRGKKTRRLVKEEYQFYYDKKGIDTEGNTAPDAAAKMQIKLNEEKALTGINIDKHTHHE